jgi:hypothetical protein
MHSMVCIDHVSNFQVQDPRYPSPLYGVSEKILRSHGLMAQGDGEVHLHKTNLVRNIEDQTISTLLANHDRKNT